MHGWIVAVVIMIGQDCASLFVAFLACVCVRTYDVYMWCVCTCVCVCTCGVCVRACGVCTCGVCVYMCISKLQE